NPRDAELLLDMGVDQIGSVIPSAQTWKDPVLKKTVEQVQSKQGKSSLIPLFRDPDTLCRAVEYYHPDLIHFCDDLLNPETDLIRQGVTIQKTLKARFPWLGIMRTLPLPKEKEGGGRDFFYSMQRFEPWSDYFLIDTWVPVSPVDGFIGITGETCDWRMAASLVKSASIPVILAGGLSPDNVYEAILAVNPAGVDSCTGTNMRNEYGRPIRFKKDFNRVRRFIDEIQRAENRLTGREPTSKN
ncbi:MAG: hypothetical protein AB1659_12145, partial [Thermodesulfobacteriota bacterium]